jgi:hypothetical protein
VHRHVGHITYMWKIISHSNSMITESINLYVSACISE